MIMIRSAGGQPPIGILVTRGLFTFRANQVFLVTNIDVYSQLNGSVLIKDWQSENFPFEKGVFQGDPSTVALLFF
jgi:hypothetical protein